MAASARGCNRCAPPKWAALFWCTLSCDELHDHLDIQKSCYGSHSNSLQNTWENRLLFSHCAGCEGRVLPVGGAHGGVVGAAGAAHPRRCGALPERGLAAGTAAEGGTVGRHLHHHPLRCAPHFETLSQYRTKQLDSLENGQGARNIRKRKLRLLAHLQQ